MMLRTSALLLLLLAACIAQSQNAEDLRFSTDAIDKTADPCADFYQFACGNWLLKHPVAPSRSYNAMFQEMRDLNTKRLAAILDTTAKQGENLGAPGARDPRTPDEQRIGDFYASCMDEKTIEAKGLQPLHEEFARIDAMKNASDLFVELARLQLAGSDAVFAVYSDQKLRDASQVILNLDQSGLNMPEVAYYVSNEKEMVTARAAYQAHLRKIFELLGDAPDAAKAAADDVLKIEVALAQSELGAVERRDRQLWYHEMTAAELQKLAPSIPWAEYFSALGFQPDGVMNVAVPKNMQTANGLVETLPMSAWKNYFRWELVRAANPELPKRFRDAEFDFYRHTLRGQHEPLPRSEECTQQTDGAVGEAVGREYVKLYFPPASKAKVLEMVGRVKTAMRADFQQTSWMSDKTKAEAIAKLDALRPMIGYPDHWRDYSQLKIVRGDAVGNLMRGQAFELRRQLAKIGKPVDRGEFYELPQSVEGYHDNPLNAIVFTAGILQPIFFDPAMDDAVNFGIAAAVMGHEMSHAFDDKGHKFDGDGNLRDWWTPEDAAHYDERAACFVKQYSEYPILDDIKVNGKLTLGENIADNGGLRLGYMAFESKPHSSEKIDGYTPEQRLFLGWAQWRCMNVNEARARELARTDPHSPGRWRVNGVVSNMEGFAKAYGCKKGDKMVNADPCRIW